MRPSLSPAKVDTENPSPSHRSFLPIALRGAGRRAEIDDHRENAAVSVLAAWEVELHEDAPNVALARPLSEHEPPRDAAVRQALGHQGQNLALAV